MAVWEMYIPHFLWMTMTEAPHGKSLPMVAETPDTGQEMCTLGKESI